MEYTMALTRRHLFPAEAKGTIYPSRNEDHVRWSNETKEHYRSRMDSWADFTIPADCTKLKVYMSGMVNLRQSLFRVCRARKIRCTLLWPTDKIKRKYLDKGIEIPRETAMNPLSYKAIKFTH